MSCCARHLRRTGPAHAGNGNELVTDASLSRQNGWSLPPQTPQLVAWSTYTFFVIVGFGIYIPLLPSPWKWVAYGVSFTVCRQLQGEALKASLWMGKCGVDVAVFSFMFLPFETQREGTFTIQKCEC